jgi:hypothetical protein
MVTESPGLFMGPTQIGADSLPGGPMVPAGLMIWNETVSQTILSTSATYYFDVAGWNVRLIASPSGGGILSLATYSAWWGFLWDFRYFDWYNSLASSTNLGDHLHISQLDNDYGNGSMSYALRNDLTNLNCVFSFNTTAYSLPSNAFSAGALTINFNVDYEDRNTSINVLNFIGALFTFSLPGIDPRLLFILMSPIIAATVYLAFIFVLRIVGSVFGGGGA